MDYLPAESNTGMFGGNSNWRGPVWMPVNALIIRALLSFYLYYGDNFKIECPTGSGKMMNLFEVAKEIADRLSRIFLRDEQRPASGLWRHGKVPVRPPLARPHPLLRILPRRQRGRAGRQPSDRLDGCRGQTHPDLRPSGSQAGPGRGQAGHVQGPAFLTRKAELLSTPAKATRHWKACEGESPLALPPIRWRKAGQVYFGDLE